MCKFIKSSNANTHYQEIYTQTRIFNHIMWKKIAKYKHGIAYTVYTIDHVLVWYLAYEYIYIEEACET